MSHPLATTAAIATPSQSSVPASTQDHFYLPELDTVRFIAFMAVFICHAFPQDTGEYLAKGIPVPVAEVLAACSRAGAWGVDLFFLLSSYLITSLLVREERATGRIDVRAFWIRRSLRIWPLYFVFTIITGLVLPRYFHFVPKLDSHHVWGLFTFTHNWVISFAGLGAGNPTLILWSVSLEEQFYILWPIVLTLAGMDRIRSIAVGMIAVSTIGRVLTIAVGLNHYPLLLWSATPLRLEPLAIGALLAVYSSRLPTLPPIQRGALIVVGAATPVALQLMAESSTWREAVTFPVASLACTAFLLGILGAPWWWLRAPVLVYLGKISYGLYVFHLLALKFSPRLTIPGLPFGRAIAGFAVTLALAALSYQFLERPFLRLKDRFAHVPSRPA